jgi:hypothetical protein
MKVVAVSATIDPIRIPTAFPVVMTPIRGQVIFRTEIESLPKKVSLAAPKEPSPARNPTELPIAAANSIARAIKG